MSDALAAGRAQFAFTVMFHYLFPMLTMGLGTLIAVLKTLQITRKDDRYGVAARFWARIFGINFAMGVITGIPMEFQFGTNWSHFSNYAGGVIGQTLAMEGVYAFFLESGFLGIFLFAEKRVSPFVHWLSSVLVAFGTLLSGYFIVATDAWMQHPVGYAIGSNGQIVLKNIWDVLGNPYAGWQYLHTINGALLTGSMVMAGTGAYYLLARRDLDFGRLCVTIGVIAGLIFSVTQLFPTGSRHGENIARFQPVKMAAMEGQFRTEAGAPLAIIGMPDRSTGTLMDPILVPKALSYLAYGDTRQQVLGLDDVPQSSRPPIEVVYYAYHIMVGLGTLFIAVLAVGGLLLWRKTLFTSRWYLWILMFSMPFPYIANEAGWTVSYPRLIRRAIRGLGPCPACRRRFGSTCGNLACARYVRATRLRRAVGPIAGLIALLGLAGAYSVTHHAGAAAAAVAPTRSDAPAAAPAVDPVVTYPVRYYTHWKSFTTANGLPCDNAKAIKVDGDRVWVGTDDGLACYEHGVWHRWGVKDGLPHQAVLALDVDPSSGDLWIGTAGGAARFTAGRFETFTQLNSGLANDLVYGLSCYNGDVWFATASGVSRYTIKTGQWAIYNQNNTLMFEPWCYAVHAHDNMVYVGVWGGGIVEYNLATGLWRDYHDPDGENEVCLIKDAGPVHDVVPAVSYVNGKLWAGSYFGLSTYDGRHWKNYFQKDSGLASDFINYVRAQGNIGWICTDMGLSSFDGKSWATYRKKGAAGEIEIRTPGKAIEHRPIPSCLADNYIFGVDFDKDSVWVATAGGVSVGRP